MDNSSSLERRYSFNMAQGSHVAESTHINGSSFAWGSVSPKLRSCSNLNISTSNSYNNCDLVDNPNIHLTKVDARIGTDVQSNGLASRIVKYHDSGTRLNRSMSAHNLFSKPGQFPVVTLKKTNLPYRAAKRELSMIRIPPPDKSSFYGNTVSGLLRSSSVIGLQSKPSEGLSTENRPIIHPPPTENDMAPTRSVLDVLKEISRKRINSDDLESEEMSKKYCCRGGNDFVDTAANKTVANQQDCAVSSPFLPRQVYIRKRQRDCTTPHQGTQLLETNTSPEQAKKRVCNYNNDITSSLSSSIKNKQISTRILNKTLLINGKTRETQKTNEPSYFDYQKTNSFENNRKNFENSNFIPSTSFSNYQNKYPVEPQRPETGTYDSDEKVATDSNRIDLDPKQRLTLFNKKYDNDESLQTIEMCKLTEKNSDNFNEEDCTSIPFVKPKKVVSQSGLRNPLMERTQKSKLALMLSGLRGELYQSPDFDELDCSSKKNVLETTANNNNLKLATSSVVSTNNIVTLTTTTATTTVTSISNVETIADVKTSLSSSPSMTANKKLSPLVGLKLKPSSKNIPNADATKTADLQFKSDVPVLSGFSFPTTSSSSSTSVVHTPINLKNDSKLMSVQLASTPITNNIGPSLRDSAKNDKISEISKNEPSSISNNLVQSPTICKALSFATSNAVTATSLIIDKTNVSNSLTSQSSTKLDPTNLQDSTATKPDGPFLTPVSSSAALTVSNANPVNAFNFTVPFTSAASSPISGVSSAPLLFGTPTNSATLTKTTVSSINTFSPSNSPLFTFNTKSSSFDGNKPTNAITSINVFGTKAQGAGSGLTFNTVGKIQGTGDQKAENKVFSCGIPAQSNSQCFNAKTTESSFSLVSNVTKSSENNFFNTSRTTPIFGSSSVKGSTEVFGMAEKSALSITPTVFGNDKTEKSMPFSFGSSTVAFGAKSTANNVNTNAGGFSFASAVANSGASGEKSNSNNTFSGASAPASQNSFMFGSPANKVNASNIFGASTNKEPETLPQGGFSFGSTTPVKTSTFNFGGGKVSGNDVASTNNASTSFTFGTPSDAKQNALSNNKPFSFGLPQKQSESTNVVNPPNIFGLGGASKATQPPAFNFTTASTQPTAPPTNIFAPPTSSVTTGPGDRPIRRATRRLQK